VHTAILEGLKQERITNITTNYLNGPVADHLKKHGLPGKLTMQTHGGRARAIIEGDTRIDIAFIATPAVDKANNGSGITGKNACGSLGYAIEDAKHSKITVLITDTIVDRLEVPQIKKEDVDHVLVVPSIGDVAGIESGTLKITNDPLGLKIARDTMRVIEAAMFLKEGVSFQSGAGGISLAITALFTKALEKKGITASFFTGGITAAHVKALEAGLVKNLYDVQCFDKVAIRSLRENANHRFMSASDYANPHNPKRKIKDLDIVILGASEIDTDFNVNVTSDSYYKIIGGSGGHADTAEDAKLSIIVSPLIKARTALIKDQLTTRTTPGEHIDCLITERGIAVNPKHKTLKKQLQAAGLNVMTIEAMQNLAHAFTDIPNPIRKPAGILGRIEGRRGETLDTLYWGES